MIITHVDPQDKRPVDQPIDFSFYQKPPNHLIVCLLFAGRKYQKTPNTLRPFCGLSAARDIYVKSLKAEMQTSDIAAGTQCNSDLWHFPQLKTGNRFSPAMYRCGRLFFIVSILRSLAAAPLAVIVDLFSRLSALLQTLH